MTFINTAYAALRLVVSAIAGFIPATLRDLGTIGAALGGGSARPSSQAAMRAALRPVAFVVVVLLVYPALRNVYVMEFIDNPRTAHENAEKAAADARHAAAQARAANFQPSTIEQPAAARRPTTSDYSHIQLQPEKWKPGMNRMQCEHSEGCDLAEFDRQEKAYLANQK